MAGIEQLEIHSKSYIIRWVKVEEGHTISFSVQPHKKSINFGIVKHPGTGGTNLTTSQDPRPLSPESSTQTDGANEQKGLFSKKDTSTAQDQLKKKGFIPVKWHGKCDADKVSMGTYDVGPGKGGMFGLVFDNTFSKQTSKTATFVLLTYPSDAPPHTTHHLPNLQAGATASKSKTSLGRLDSPRMVAVTAESVDSLHSHSTSAKGDASNYHVGTLMKRRRKRGQGYARRFFSLDYATCTLSYYHNRNSSALRGAIPLSLAAVAADERRREISIDSGAEIWHLRASNQKDFTDWAHALERSSRIARGVEPMPEGRAPQRLSIPRTLLPGANTPQEEEREWQQVEALVSRVVGTRDALRRLVKDMSAQKNAAAPSSRLSPASADDPDGYFTPAVEKRPFWKRKSSATLLTPTGYGSSVPNTPTATTTNGLRAAGRKSKDDDLGMHHHCNALLGDLDSVVAEFSHLLANSKRRRMPVPGSAASRHSIETTSTEEFFDAAEGDADRSQLLMIDHQSGEEENPRSDTDDQSFHGSASDLSEDEEDDYTSPDGTSNLYPAKPSSMSPLPITEDVKRRTSIPPSTCAPPSLIAFVRKNVGKDLSTVSMPVSSNEPTSLLQRVAEQLEYAQLLDTATKQKNARERMLYVAAFAVSQFSGGRHRERAARKPFNPLLGETFELVRTEADVPGGFRLLVEKVSHRPVRLAMHADGRSWSFAQAPAPSQKFWGKSAEITTEGRIRIVLRLPDGTEERYSWNLATMFLRNVVMGEKYVEPVGTMNVANDSSGAKATVEFRSRGMFGGRGEDVQVETFGPDGSHTGASLTGTWTGGLKIVEAGGRPGAEIWKPAALVPNPAATYGLTAFAAELNEITPLEKGKLAPTDSRLRPDQRLAEEGRLDEAESWKEKLEEAQRSRRRALEERGEEHRPKWFVKVASGQEGDEVWKIRGGKEGYWEERAKNKGQWSGIEDIFGGE